MKAWERSGTDGPELSRFIEPIERVYPRWPPMVDRVRNDDWQPDYPVAAPGLRAPLSFQLATKGSTTATQMYPRSRVVQVPGLPCTTNQTIGPSFHFPLLPLATHWQGVYETQEKAHRRFEYYQSNVAPLLGAGRSVLRRCGRC